MANPPALPCKGRCHLCRQPKLLRRYRRASSTRMREQPPSSVRTRPAQSLGVVAEDPEKVVNIVDVATEKLSEEMFMEEGKAVVHIDGDAKDVPVALLPQHEHHCVVCS